MPEIILKAGRERSVLRQHPWIFSGAVARLTGKVDLGGTVDVISSNGEFLARAAYNPNSNITGRIWTWDEDEQVDRKLFETRIDRAIAYRRNLPDFSQSNAMRLVYAESDGIPGLILDRYDDIYVVQFLTAGVECWRETIIDIIIRATNARTLYERSDVDVRQLEGLPMRDGLLHGQLPLQPVIITENNLQFQIDVANGHKTGFYLDQKDNRLLARKISAGLDVLDCFSYSGGFAINSIAGNANHVTLVDSSSQALALATENFALNNLGLERVKIIEQDVFKYLRILRDVGETFDLVILDPPKFAPTAAQAERATRGYKDINLLALKILRPGGYLLTFSCSGGVNEDLFQKILAGAALDAGIEAEILLRLHQASDHPVALNFPESAYLKGFLIHKRGQFIHRS